MPPCWLEITAEFKVEDASTDASVITSIDTKNEPLSWFWKRNYIIHSMNVENEWKQITIRIDLPALKNPNDILSVSVINDLKSAVESRNVNIRLFSK